MIRKLILTYEFGGWVTGIFNDCTTASWRIDDFHVNAPTSTVVTHDYWEIEEFALSLEYTECDKKEFNAWRLPYIVIQILQKHKPKSIDEMGELLNKYHLSFNHIDTKYFTKGANLQLDPINIGMIENYTVCGDIVDDKVNFFYAYKGNFSFIFGDYSEVLFATKATIFQDFNSKVFLNEV